MQPDNYMQNQAPYCNSLTQPSRLQTIEVPITIASIGGNNPIRIQSMTTTDTMDTEGTVAQSIRMIEAGCELVRITAPSLKEAENLRVIKDLLRKKGYKTPLVADIHYTPNAAELAATIVEKVRINPGNYADKKQFKTIEYTDNEYNNELERIYKRFAPLVKICKQNGTAMRIGTNHGSLSDRIMSRYGDTPLGMVESAFEFIRICEDLGYYALVISMKASNPQTMVQAYRLLAQRLIQHGKIYPLHLGVTEAGEGADGRIKSALGIGALLADGLGDTVRVSLTEPTEAEIPVAQYIVDGFEDKINKPPLLKDIPIPINPFEFKRRKTIPINNIGGENVPRVIADFNQETIKESDLEAVGYIYSEVLDKWNMTDVGCDYIYAGKNIVPFMPPNGLKIIYDSETWKTQNDKINTYPYFQNPKEFLESTERSKVLNFVGFSIENEYSDLKISNKSVVLVLENKTSYPINEWRNMIFSLMGCEVKLPIILKYNIVPYVIGDDEQYFQMATTCELGILVDGLVDGLWLSIPPKFSEYPKLETRKLLNQTAFDILQAARLRITKTEYISCPSCGRTLFDLQETTAKIRARTEHLKGVKIGIMGCIVNGPGEMADADYGYVGSGVGVITLYRGKEVVEAKVKTEFAVDKLIELIKNDGKWIEPNSSQN